MCLLHVLGEGDHGVENTCCGQEVCVGMLEAVMDNVEKIGSSTITLSILHLCYFDEAFR